jgi:hypothetical protein
MRKHILLLCLALGATWGMQAQPERVGQVGALELLINSMPKSSGVNGLDVGSVNGIEASQVNPAGVARTTGTELLFSHTLLGMGTDLRINSFGFSQGLGSNGSLGISVNALDLGEFIRTTPNQPNGELGPFSPTLLNVGLTYARKFTDRIHVGFTARLINQTTPEISATGVGFDAGIQYRSGEKDRVKLGIALRNVGPTMRFGGDGLSRRTIAQTGNSYTTTLQLSPADYEIPATLSMGGSYDFFLSSDMTLTALATFISNSYFFNQGGAGLEWRYKRFVALRGSFLYEEGVFGDQVGTDRFSWFTGFSGGATFQIPFNIGKFDASGNPDFSKFSLDLSYRTMNPFTGTFVIGARIDI